MTFDCFMTPATRDWTLVEGVIIDAYRTETERAAMDARFAAEYPTIGIVG